MKHICRTKPIDVLFLCLGNFYQRNVDIRIDIDYNIYTIVIRGECDERERAFEKTC